MKKLTLLFIVCMVSMLASAQTQSPNYLGNGFDAPPPGLETDEGTTQPLVTNGCVTLTPDTRGFGTQPVDFATASKPFYLQNGCNVNLTVNNITANGQSFTQTNNCIGTLPPGPPCEIDVVFDPVSAGDKSQTLVINYHKQGNPNPM